VPGKLNLGRLSRAYEQQQGQPTTESLQSFDNEKLLQRVASGSASYFDEELFYWISGQLLQAFYHAFTGKKHQAFVSYPQPQIAYGYTDPAILTAFELNVFHFSAAKTLAEIQQLNALFRKAGSIQEFKQEAEKITRVFNEQWMQTEYDTAYLVGESTATYQRLMQQAELFPYWQYRTQGDDKVRPTHAALDNLVLPYNDAHWNSIYPPNGWNCRCYVVPLMRHEADNIDFSLQRDRVAAYYQTPEWQSNQAQGWAVNRAQIGQIFTENQFYIRKFPGQAARYLNRLTYEQWGLPSVEKMRQQAADNLTAYRGTAAEWWDKLKKLDGEPDVALLTDYAGRKIMLMQENFVQHTTGSRASRVAYLQALLDTLHQPDEVWVNGPDAYNQWVWVKYYQDEALVVIGQLSERLALTLNTWFPLMERKKSVVMKYRRGLLLRSSAPGR